MRDETLRKAIIFIFAMCCAASAFGASLILVTGPVPPPGISADFFGIQILGPIETNVGGSGEPLVWPVWNPTSFRAISNYGGVPPGYTYLQGISQWSAVETSSGVYDWSLFDLVWAKLMAQGVTSVDYALEDVPQWAEVGNAYSFTGSAIALTNCVVTAPSNNFANGWQVFFSSGGTFPTGITAGTVYTIGSYGVDGAGKFRLVGQTCTGTAGSGLTVTASNSPPASMSTLTTWVTAYLTRAALDGLPIKFVEGPNEASNGVGFSVASMTEFVTMQQTIYNAAKAYDSNIKVLTPPTNGFTVGGTVGPGNATGGYTWLNAFLVAGGGSYADIMAFHGYAPDSGTCSPVTYASGLASFITMLATNGQGSKPLWNSEYSTATLCPGASVPAEDETYLARTTFIDLDQGVARKYYYAYDAGIDVLWGPPTTGVPGVLNAAGIAYDTLTGWLTGATLTSRISTVGVVSSVNLTLSGGMQAQAVWTTDGSTPSYSVPSWATQYETLAGSTVTGLGSTVTIGANPILFTTGSMPPLLLPAYNNVQTNWQNAGLAVIGGIPSRTTQCGATLTPSGGDDLTQITSAIAACPSNEFVKFGAGTFLITMSEYILLDKSITLRGTGTCNNGSDPRCQTIINVSNGMLPTYAGGGQCGVDTSHIVSCVYNPAIYVSPPSGLFDQLWSGCPTVTTATGCSTALDADASQGQTTIQVHSLTNFSVGMWVRIDEASGAANQTDPSNSGCGTLNPPTCGVFAASDFTASSGSPATGKIAYAGAGVEIGWAYGALYDRETSEIHLISAVGAGPCPGTNCTITFDSPLTIAYRHSSPYFAQVYWPTNGSSSPIAFLQKAGVENITITRATAGPVYMTFCAYCWISNVEASGWSKGIALSNVVRSELIGSYIHDCYDCENNGTEYPISIDGATTESLVSNNIIRLGGKGMVARSAGGGNVVSYNYQDDTFYMATVIGNYWLDQGTNGSHYVGSHHILFEGNYGTNCDDDETHGNVVYHTFFRNWCAGLRSNFNDPSFTTTTSVTYNPTDAPVSDLDCFTTGCLGFAQGNSYPYSGGTAIHRAASSMRWDYWHAFVGNVLGESGVTTTGNGWSYAQYTQSNNNIWMFGWSGGECPGCSDNNLNGTTGSYYFRHGNYDYLHNSIVDWQAGYTHMLPNSLYLSSAPTFFSAGTCTYPWPWVTPTSGTVIQTNSCSGSGNPAQARWNAGTPFVQP